MGRNPAKPDVREARGTPKPGEAIVGPMAVRPGMASRTIASSRWATLLAAVVIALATVAAYSNTFHNPFIFDDEKSISENPTIRGLWPIWPVLLPPADGSAVQRRPVVNLSLAINYAVSGEAVWSYHALNLIAHVLAALLLFGIVRRTLLLPGLQERGSRAAAPLAFAVALLWAVHPLLTEAVTYVVQRTEVLAGLFYLLTLYCVIRGAGSARGWAWYAAAVAACALAMGSKETAILAPLVALLYDRVFLSVSWRDVFRRRWGLYVGLAATWAVILVMLPQGREGVAVFAVPENAGMGQLLGEGYQNYRSIDYTLAQFGVIAHYLRLCFWPHPLLIDYGFYAPPTAAQIIPYALLIGGLLAATLVAFRYQPWLGFLGVWFFAILAPSSSVVPLFQQIAAEKRMYLPLAAVVTGVVIGAYLAGRRLVDRGVVSPRAAQITGIGLVALAGIALGTLTFHRNTAYSTTVSIWEDAVAKMPDNARAHDGLGYALVGQSRFNEAIVPFRKALQLSPDYAEAHDHLGGALIELGRFGDALVHLQKAVELKPGLAETHNNLGVALADCGHVAEAKLHYQKALELKPGYAAAHFNLANALADEGSTDDAIVQFRKALASKPDYVEAHCNLGAALAGRARYDEAMIHFQKALKLKPDHVAARSNLGTALCDCGRFDEAILECQEALRLQPAFPRAQDTLLAAQAQREQLRQTLARWRKSLESQPNNSRLLNAMAYMLATNPNASIRNGAEAVALARRTVELSGGREPAFLDTLAAAYAEAGQFTDAVRTARQAADLAARQNKAALAESIRAKIPLYQAGTPFRGK